MKPSFESIIGKVKECEMKTVAVAAAQDDAVLAAVKEAKEKGIANAILVGDEAKIREIAAEMGMNLDDGYEIINEPDLNQAALTAVKLAHDGKADMYMKGLVDSKTFLKSVFQSSTPSNISAGCFNMNIIQLSSCLRCDSMSF